MDSNAWLIEVRELFARYKSYSERGAAQVSDEDFFLVLGHEENSVAILMKHVGGNLRSRWRHFLTEDGEKPDRYRDTEFEVVGQTRDEIEAVWEEGWRWVLDELDALEAADLGRTVTIRGEPHSVFGAIQRSLTHTAYHTGQIVQLARHHAGGGWKTLSIPRGRSEEFNRAMRERSASS